MKRFNDATGKQIEIDVHIESIERVKSIPSLDLTQLFADKMQMVNELTEDPLKLASVIWELQTSQASDKAAFLRGMKGDAIEAAFKALVEDVIDFFPNARRREICRATVAKLWETVEAIQDQATQELAAINPTSLLTVTNSPESAERTQAPATD